MKKICVFVGSRANYSSCKSIMKAINAHPDLELQTVLGGAAVLDRFGNIEKLLEQDGFTVTAKFYMIVEGENPTTMSKSTGLGIIELSMVFSNLKPDLVLVVGDRFDIMAPVIAATFMNIPLAHTMGGEVSGTIDESIRHAVTKMAHVHFPANEDARQRIIKLGEDPAMVFNVGCPRIDTVKHYLDDHRTGGRINQEEFFGKYKGVGGMFNIEKEKFLLVSQHPVTTEYGDNRAHIEETLQALKELAMPTIMIWPNADAGSDEISKGIRHFREKEKPEWLHLFINLPVEVYVKLMDLSACMIGNSSSSVREGAYIGSPAVNVGTRQQVRVRGKNLTDVEYDRKEIVKAVRHWLKAPRPESEAIYGNGEAGARIASILAGLKHVPIQKCIQY
ncbi:MAG: UDP-N-acetylglucosamine 2-epimerase [Fibrobacteres bacterium]|nr:UDP-N-acetylglucosamine 2-epimerase [Fibrobacterota bacterium]